MRISLSSCTAINITMKTLKKGDNAEVLIRKHRNGSVGTVELQFVGELTQFRDVEFRDMGPEQ